MKLELPLKVGDIILLGSSEQLRNEGIPSKECTQLENTERAVRSVDLIGYGICDNDGWRWYVGDDSITSARRT